MTYLVSDQVASTTNRQISKYSLKKSISHLATTLRKESEPNEIEVPHTLKNQKSQKIAIYTWMISTLIWSSTYTIPYSNAANWPEYRIDANNMTSEMIENRQNELSENMSIYGMGELTSRLLQVFFAHLVPERKFATFFGLNTFLSAIAIFMLCISNFYTRKIFFIFFPLFTGFLNGLLYGATQDIFGAKDIGKFWPLVNLFLALGFFLGPVVTAGMTLEIEFLGNLIGIDRVLLPILLVLAGLMMLITQKQVVPLEKKEKDVKNIVQGDSGSLEIVFSTDILKQSRSKNDS